MNRRKYNPVYKKEFVETSYMWQVEINKKTYGYFPTKECMRILWREIRSRVGASKDDLHISSVIQKILGMPFVERKFPLSNNLDFYKNKD